jgi:hypothetical protein
VFAIVYLSLLKSKPCMQSGMYLSTKDPRQRFQAKRQVSQIESLITVLKMMHVPIHIPQQEEALVSLLCTKVLCTKV